MNLKNCLTALAVLGTTSAMAGASPIRLPVPPRAESPVSTAAPSSITEAVFRLRDAFIGYLTIPLGAVPFEEPPQDRR